MRVLQLFITPVELQPLLQEVAVDHSLRAAVLEHGAPRLLPENSPLVFEESRLRPRLFLFPPEAWSGETKPRPRYDGWIDITVGELFEIRDSRVLTLTTIQAGNRKNLSFKPATWLTSLRKRLSASCIFGIQGRNVVHGGSDDYQDMAYSPSALELYQQGVLWKQYVNDNAEFSPL